MSRKPFRCMVTTGIRKNPYDNPTEKRTAGPFWLRGASRNEVVLALTERLSPKLPDGRTIIKIVATVVKEDEFNRAMVVKGTAAMLPGLDLNTGKGDKPKPVVSWRKRDGL